MHCLATDGAHASPGRGVTSVLVGRNGRRVPKSYMMNFELISAEVYDNLPEDDEQCFVEFEGTYRRNTKSMLEAVPSQLIGLRWSCVASHIAPETFHRTKQTQPNLRPEKPARPPLTV